MASSKVKRCVGVANVSGDPVSAFCWPAHCVPNICMRVEEGLGLVGVRCANLCGPPLKRLEKFDKAFCQKYYTLLFLLTKKMASVDDKSSPAKEEKNNLVLCYCTSLKVSPVNINDDQMQLFPTYTFLFLL